MNMKFRLRSIGEEPTYKQASETAVPEPDGGFIVLAHLQVVNVPQMSGPYVGVTVPYAMIKGAQVGDEFTVYFERVRQ